MTTLLCFAACILFATLSSTSDISLQLSSSKSEEYTTTTVYWGTPSQGPFTLILDSTSDTSILIGTEVSSSQTRFISKHSSTFNSTNHTLIYKYHNLTIDNYEYASDILTLSSATITHQALGISDDNPSLFTNEEIDGSLAIGYKSVITQALLKTDDISFDMISINVDSNEVCFGECNEQTINKTEIPVISNQSSFMTDPKWTFEISEMLMDNFNVFGNYKLYAVIDTASPFIIIYCKDYITFQKTILFNIGGDCDPITFECSNYASIVDYIQITVNANDTFWMAKNDFVKDEKYLMIRYGNNTQMTGDYWVFFMGYPFLTGHVIQLQTEQIIIGFVDDGNGSSTDVEWTVIIIVLVCVVFCTVLFFVGFLWKYKIPKAEMNEQPQDGQLLMGNPGLDANMVYNDQYINHSSIPDSMNMDSFVVNDNISNDSCAITDPLLNINRDGLEDIDEEVQLQSCPTTNTKSVNVFVNDESIDICMDDNVIESDDDDVVEVVESKPVSDQDLREKRLKYLEEQEKKRKEAAEELNHNS